MAKKKTTRSKKTATKKVATKKAPNPELEKSPSPPEVPPRAFDEDAPAPAEPPQVKVERPTSTPAPPPRDTMIDVPQVMPQPEVPLPDPSTCCRFGRPFSLGGGGEQHQALAFIAYQFYAAIELLALLKQKAADPEINVTQQPFAALHPLERQWWISGVATFQTAPGLTPTRAHELLQNQRALTDPVEAVTAYNNLPITGRARYLALRYATTVETASLVQVFG